jgi:hypothetical protein
MKKIRRLKDWKIGLKNTMHDGNGIHSIYKFSNLPIFSPLAEIAQG